MKKFLKTTLVILLFVLCACSNEKEQIIYDSSDDLNGQKIGVLTGTVFENISKRDFPDSEILYCSTVADEITALREKKIEGFITDYGIAILACKENDELTFFNEEHDSFDYSGIFSMSDKGLALRNEFNEFLDNELEDYNFYRSYHEWANGNRTEILDYKSLPNIKGSITVATDGESFPFVYMSQNKLTGFEVELVYKFCEAKGYALNFEISNFSGTLAAVASGKADMATSGICYTDERAEKFYFSKSYLNVGSLLVIRKDSVKNSYQILSDLNGKEVSCISGTIYDGFLLNYTQDVTFQYYDSTTDEVNALLQGKVAATLINSNLFIDLKKEIPNLRIIDSIYDDYIGYIFAKSENPSLLNLQLDEFIKTIKENGELEKITNKWHSEVEENDLDYESFDGHNGTIRYALQSAAGKPMCYMLEGKYAGIEVDIITRFAKEYGYDVEFQDYSFAGVLAAVASGKADLGGANITISDERKKSMNFSIPYFVGQVYAVTIDRSIVNNELSATEKFLDSFHKTFIQEERYKLFLDGVKTTLFIALCSCALGSVLGFAIYFLFRNNHGVMSKLLNAYSWFVTGLPTVVFIMIFYYVIFVKTGLSAESISILAFSILFSLAVFSLLKTCFIAIDKGQFEAGYALGYSKSKTITKIIIPEIAPMFFPAYRGALVDLIKATSIVGYIAVQDLTKVSDIIRSRTYEAFFPLIAITIIYFLIILLLDVFTRFLERRFNTRNRKLESILKGVKTK